VAASGSNETLRPWVAVTLLAAIAIALVVTSVVRPRMIRLDDVPFENPPEVLAAKARDIAVSLGYGDRPADVASGFATDLEHDLYQRRRFSVGEVRRLLGGPPSPVTFWYRQSPSPIVPDDPSGEVSIESPTPRIPDSVLVVLEPDGRLRQFTAVPRQFDTSTAEAPIDWSKLFAAAHLDQKSFQPVAPQWAPFAATDARAAWTGTYPGRADLAIRVEAASFHGRPVLFQIVWPWTARDRVAPAFGRPAIVSITNLVLLAFAALLARQNMTTGRGDTRGATRLALFIVAVSVLRWALLTHHVRSWQETTLFEQGLANAIFNGFTTWVVYLALEPRVRRHWPQSLIGWSRVLAGRWNDALVGREVLVAILTGLLPWVLGAAILLANQNERVPAGAPLGWPVTGRLIGSTVGRGIIIAVFAGLLGFFMLFLLRVLLRRRWLAVAVLTVIIVLSLAPYDSRFFFVAPSIAIVAGFMVATLVRLGLLAAVTAALVFTLTFFVSTARFTTWYGQLPLVNVVIVIAIALWAFRASLGGRPVFRESVFD
jgi:hypothetical protein